ncbi:AMP-binding protein, partial [Listeria monocytogenes]|uniref:condensation domain-containing protein n=4 Tax=Listeria TaxID=1637 RepID=UPI0011EB3995
EMSPAQQRMFIQQLNEGGTIYNIPQVHSFKGVLKEERLRAAFNELIQRHEVLRTTYALQEGRGVQYVQDTQEMDVVFYPFVPTEGYEAYIQPFDLQKGPLFRARVFTEQETSHLFLDFHHSISDGESVGLFLRELMDAYEGGKQAPLQYQYKDYSEWIHQLDQETSQVYWKNELKDLPVMELPLDYPRQEKQSFRGKMLRKSFSVEDSEKIRNLAKENHTTEYVIFMSLVMMTLKKFSGQSEIVLGTVSNGRISHEVENLLGMFVNTLVMRGKVSERTTYPQFIQQLKEKFFTNLTHQHYPLENIIQDLEVPRDASRNPLFDVMYSFEGKLSTFENEYNGFLKKGTTIATNSSKFDLNLIVIDSANKFVIEIEYTDTLFSKESVESILNHLFSLSHYLLDNPNEEVGAISKISKNDLKYLNEINSTKQEYPGDKTVNELFEATALDYPEKTAVVFGDKSWSYSELNRRGNQVAHRLMALGIEPGEAVGIVAERSLSMIAGLI